MNVRVLLIGCLGLTTALPQLAIADSAQDRAKARSDYAVVTSCELDKSRFPLADHSRASHYNFQGQAVLKRGESPESTLYNCQGAGDVQLMPVNIAAVDDVAGRGIHGGVFYVTQGEHKLRLTPDIVVDSQFRPGGESDTANSIQVRTRAENQGVYNPRKWVSLDLDAGYAYVLAARYHGGDRANWSLVVLDKHPLD